MAQARINAPKCSIYVRLPRPRSTTARYSTAKKRNASSAVSDAEESGRR